MAAHPFDAIALGPDLGTALAAALLARRGLRVLLAPGRTSPGAYQLGAHRISDLPEVLTSHDRAVVEQVIDELELKAFLEHRLRDNDPPLQLILPECRVDVDADDELLVEQLVRELALAPAEIERVLVKAALGSRSMAMLIEQRQQWLSEGASQWPAEPLGTEPGSLLHDILRGPTAAVSPVVQDQLGDLVVARNWSSWRRGTYSITGGLLSLRLELHNIVVAAGGEILMDADPIGLLQRPDGSVAGVMLEGRPGTIRTERLLVGDIDLARLAGLLREGSPQRRRLPRPAIVARRFVVYLAFRRGWLPASMGDNLIFLRARGLHGGFLHVVHEDPTLTSEEELLSAQTLVSARRATRFDLVALRRAVVAELARVVPFFDECFLYAASPHVDQAPLRGSVGGVEVPGVHRRTLPMPAVYSLEAPPTTPEGEALTGEALAGAPGASLDLGSSSIALTHPLLLGALGTEGAFTAAVAAADFLAGPAPK